MNDGIGSAARPLILASQSPRRREILEKLGMTFTVCPAESEVGIDSALPLCEAVKAVARAKAEEVAATHPGRAVLGADTVVAIGETVLGKPRDEADAKAMLRALSGRDHRVVTAVWVVDEAGVGRGFASDNRVTFAPLSDEEIAAYVATGEPMDKAGAYGIQGIGGRFITGIHGDFYAVMGLPCGELWQFLKQWDEKSKKSDENL